MFRATDRLYRTTNREFNVAECTHCGLIRLDPFPTPAELAAYYPSGYWYVPGGDAASRMEEAYRVFVLGDHIRFVKRALRGLDRNGLVLDVGCGGGLFLRLLQSGGYRVLGLDSSEQAASVAARSGVPAITAALDQAPLKPRSCIAITMFHVLEHLYEPDVYLKCARELLAPEGRLVVQVPNAASWQFLLLGENWNGLDVPRHLTNFRARDIEALISHCGFEIVSRKFFSLRDNPAGLATSIAPALDPMARRLRGQVEPPRLRLLRDLAYLTLVVAALPFTAIEAACGAGSSVMIEARPK